MLSDVVLKKSDEAFTKQVNSHQAAAENMRQIESQGSTSYQSVLSDLMASVLSEVLPTFEQWWTLDSRQAKRFVDINEQMATGLEKALHGFNETDEKVAKGFARDEEMLDGSVGE